MTGLLAHGGAGGAVVEIALTLTILLVFVVVWRRERKAKSEDVQ